MRSIVPLDRINWVTSIFLLSTALIALTAVPVYIWNFGLDPFLGWLFLAYFIATGLSITLGYHRLFAHLSFKAKWPVRLFVILFGAAAFENSVLDWVADHRIHHKHVDEEEDPYNIKKGFFHAHIGWLLFKLHPDLEALTNVADLKKDKLVMWQHSYCHWIGLAVGFVVPTLLGFWHGGAVGALGGFLIPGIARLVFVQHMTFFINSLCHYVGARPYSSQCSARDSMLMAFFTFGEGYHNYHHEFQHDYRNGVKPWQFDPTKWTIWTLEKLGLVSNLRRVPAVRILLAELKEKQMQVDGVLQADGFCMPEDAGPRAQASLDYVRRTAETLAQVIAGLQAQLDSQKAMAERPLNALRREVNAVTRELDWHLGVLRSVGFGKVAVSL